MQKVWGPEFWKGVFDRRRVGDIGFCLVKFRNWRTFSALTPSVLKPTLMSIQCAYRSGEITCPLNETIEKQFYLPISFLSFQLISSAIAAFPKLNHLVFQEKRPPYQTPLHPVSKLKMHSSTLAFLFLVLTSSSLADFEVNLAQSSHESNEIAERTHFDFESLGSLFNKRDDCGTQYGPTWVDCGPYGCYQPSLGQVCCPGVSSSFPFPYTPSSHSIQ